MAAGMGTFTATGMKKLQQKLNKVQQDQIDDFLDECAKEIAARLLAKAIKRTPVGQYPASSGKKGGTLRRGWTSGGSNNSGGGSSAKAFANSLTVNHIGNMYQIVVKNPVEYASYVEYGHRTRDHTGWVPGRFMLTISEQEVQMIAPNVLESKIKKFLGGVFK